MKRLMTIVLAALLSLSIASVSLAQNEPAGGTMGGASETPHAGKTKKKHKKKHRTGKKKRTPAAEQGMQQ